MAFAAPLLPLLPTILSAGASAVAGVSAIQNGLYQAQVGKNNAEIAEQNAAAASLASQQEAARSDREYAALRGEQLAAQGASGLDILGRTQVAARDLTRRVAGEARTDIRLRGQNEARGLMQDAANFRAEGRQAKLQGFLSGAGSFLEAGSTLSKGLGKTRSLATSRRPRNPFRSR